MNMFMVNAFGLMAKKKKSKKKNKKKSARKRGERDLQ